MVRKWKEDVPVKTQFNGSWRSLKTLLGYFGISYRSNFFQNFKVLVEKIMDPSKYPAWCTTKADIPSLFWMKVLGSKLEIDPELQKLVKTLLVLPLGSSEAERAFSNMNKVNFFLFLHF